MKVLVFPKDSNPYQELLYKPMRKNVAISYLVARHDGPFWAATYVPRLLLHLMQYRLQGYRILHIHWLYKLAVPSFIPFAKKIAYLQTCIFLYGARLFGYKIVWTVHNVIPHGQITSDDLAIRQKLGRLSAAVIVHSQSTIIELAANNIRTDNCNVIPHGNYIGVYPNALSQHQARAKLKLPVKSTVITFFGTIYAYKNVPELIKAFASIADKDLYLLMAGTCKDTRVTKLIKEYKNTFGDRIRLYDKYIADDEVQLYMNAADICAFPFTEITSSGSVLLACSFGKPIVVPCIGALQDLPRDIGYLYSPTDSTSLETALESVINNKRKWSVMATVSRSYAAQLDWSTIARATEQLYNDAI